MARTGCGGGLRCDAGGTTAAADGWANGCQTVTGGTTGGGGANIGSTMWSDQRPRSATGRELAAKKGVDDELRSCFRGASPTACADAQPTGTCAEPYDPYGRGHGAAGATPGAARAAVDTPDITPSAELAPSATAAAAAATDADAAAAADAVATMPQMPRIPLVVPAPAAQEALEATPKAPPRPREVPHGSRGTASQGM